MAATEEAVLECTKISKIPEIVARLRASYCSHCTLDYEYRMGQLRNLKRMIDENREAIEDALERDLNRSKQETFIMEFAGVEMFLVEALNDLSDWMAPKHQPKDLLNKFNSVYVQAEPYGVVLNIAPWNYPFQLLLSGLIGIIAAGNACVLKPSEYAVKHSNLIAKLIPKYLDPECYAVVTGGVDVGQALMKERYDYIMFTGAPSIGKIIMREAAANLTPVLLELGGKSPVIVAKDANLAVTGRRIAWGKAMNAGQTCIAPDYVLCMRDQRDKVVDAIKKAFVEFFGENPKDSPDFGRMIHSRHFQRVVGLLKGTQGTLVYGGESDPQTRYIAPTIVTDVTADDKLMEEEIFGPILPIVAVDNLDEAIKFVNKGEKPLAMYVFTESKAMFERVMKFTSAGGVTHNDTLLHAGAKLPFGGVGQSGCGVYHGKYSFDTFSHYKPILSTGTGMDLMLSMRYPPYNKSKYRCIKWLLSKSEKSSRGLWKMLALFGIFLLSAVVQFYGLPSWLY